MTKGRVARGVLLVVLLGTLSAPRPGAAAPAPGQEGIPRGHLHEGPYGDRLLDLEKKLRCNCGCKLDVHVCQYQMQCGTSPTWSKRILQALERGESEETILAGFVADFGPTVLVVPPEEGFNLVGYYLPWVTILTVAAVLGAIFRRRRAPEPVPVRELTPEEEARIREELERLQAEEELPDF